MIPMTVKEFDSLCKRDFENGAVRDSIRIALKERESLLSPIPEEKKARIIQKYSAEIMTCASYMRAMGLMRQAIKEYEKEKESADEK